jgi:hypothetical protein
LDRSQTSCDRFISCVSLYFAPTTTPFGVYFRILCTAAVFARFEKFFHCCFPVLPLPESTETFAVTAAADPVDFEEMAAEQNCCAEMQLLLGSSSLKLAFHQIGGQCLAGDISTGVLCPIVSERIFFHIFTMLLTPGGLPPIALFHLGLCGTGCPTTSPPGRTPTWAASRARSIATPA